MAASSANPFRRDNFAAYRDWEAALFAFFAEQVEHPCTEDWKRYADDEATSLATRGSAVFLANLVAARRPESASALYRVTKELGGMSASTVEQWLRTGWLDVGRTSSALASSANSQRT